jgi:predicted nucleic acid-binding protein
VNEGDVAESDLVRVVLGDANVLYPRVLRDYLLYAADQEVISIVWSGRILDEVTRHLVANVPGFTEESGKRLVSAMNAAFPYAEVEPTVEHYQRLEGRLLPDEDDRHVLAAAIAAEATVLCTANTKDFPKSGHGVGRCRADDAGRAAVPSHNRVRTQDARRPRCGRRQLARSERRVDHPRASASRSARSSSVDGRPTRA